MSAPHLRALEAALASRGWRVVAVYPGDGYGVSATWELKRGGREGALHIDFDGLGPDGDVCLPLEESYGCHARGHPAGGLYFGRVNGGRAAWERGLAAFVQSLDNVAGEPGAAAERRPAA